MRQTVVPLPISVYDLARFTCRCKLKSIFVGCKGLFYLCVLCTIAHLSAGLDLLFYHVERLYAMSSPSRRSLLQCKMLCLFPQFPSAVTMFALRWRRLYLGMDEVFQVSFLPFYNLSGIIRTMPDRHDRLPSTYTHQRR